ncbi:MAG: DUF3185 family protein [Spirochaetes bacterium]|nr:DUF3185 family protein [Spirochaetota bacterium]
MKTILTAIGIVLAVAGAIGGYHGYTMLNTTGAKFTRGFTNALGGGLTKTDMTAWLWIVLGAAAVIIGVILVLMKKKK